MAGREECISFERVQQVVFCCFWGCLAQEISVVDRCLGRASSGARSIALFSLFHYEKLFVCRAALSIPLNMIHGME